MASSVVDYPCGACKKQCNKKNLSVACEKCESWYHVKCENLSKSDFEFLNTCPLDYICHSCCLHENYKFNYDFSLERMAKASDTRSMNEVVRLEQIFLRNEDNRHLSERVKFDKNSPYLRQDVVTLNLLSNFIISPDKIPAYTTGDGNCLYNALSLALIGDESLSSELRVRTCIELNQNKEAYALKGKPDGLDMVSESIEDACRSTACNGRYSSVWALQAAATVINLAITSVYPPVNGLSDNCMRILNKTFYPLGPKKCRKEPIQILWTSGLARFRGTWTPNHFVPLIHKSCFRVTIDFSSPIDFPPLNRQTQAVKINKIKLLKTNLQKSKKVEQFESQKTSQQFSQNNLKSNDQDENVAVNDESTNCPTLLDLSDPMEIQIENDYFANNSPCNPQDTESCQPLNISDATVNQSLIDHDYSMKNDDETDSKGRFSAEHFGTANINHDFVDETCLNSQNSFSDESEHSVSFNENPPPIDIDGTFKIQTDRFIETDKIFELLTSDETPVLDEIPRLLKQNIYFVYDHKPNLENKQNGRRMNFWDDCGVWAPTVTRTEYFIKDHNGHLKYITKQNSKFGIRLRKKFDVLNPQPQETELIILKRYYASLKRDNSYKKRLSWIEQFPGSPPFALEKAVAEYLGKYPHDMKSVHGNAKNMEQEFIRTSPQTKQKVRSDLGKNKKVREIYTDSLLSDQNVPRDRKYIENMKTRLINEKTGNAHRKNNADDVQQVISMISQSHPYVQEIVQLSGKPPNIICYTKNQIDHMLNCCSRTESNCIVGVDRTFNLGACYVTCMVYQDQNLKRKSKDNPPILLGPIYLHWDGNFVTYQRFFSHVAAVFKNNLTSTLLNIDNMVFGTDEEKALVNAIKSSFPTTSITLCTRHIEENVKRHLKNKIGMSEKNCKETMDLLFGCEGLSKANTSLDFELKVAEIEENVSENLLSYIGQKIIPTLRNYVLEPRKTDNIPPSWKNNNCESMNHVLKMNIDWKPKKLPDLIEILQKQANLQEALIKRALHGLGEYELVGDAQHLKISHTIWQSKTEEEKNKLLKKFLNFRKKTQPSTITSTDGKLTIPKTKTTATKPGQKRRIKSEKSHSAPKKTKND